MKKVYVLLGPPVSWKRPGRNGKLVYNPHSMAMDRARFDILAQRGRATKPIDGPISIDITFFMPIAAKYSLKKRSLYIDQPHFIRPDLDRLINFLLDSAKCLYKDDAQIAVITAKKVYSDDPRTEFTIESME